MIGVVTASIIQAYSPFSIIDSHEHIEGLTRADVLLAANETAEITKTILIPSPTETLTLNGQRSFTGYRENTDDIFAIAEKYPEKFIPFCTVSPLDSDALEYVQSCVERGGKGIKLYNGHSYYYSVFGLPLSSARMTSIYAFAEKNGVPLLFHINITKYGEQLEEILNEFPELVVSVPHFMVSSIGLDKVSALLNSYPNLYTDISFGSPEFMAAGFRRISKNPAKYANFVNEFQDRILFGADMVLSKAEQKDQIFMEETLHCYRNMLEERRYSCAPVSKYYNDELAKHQYRYDLCKPKEGDYCSKTLKAKVDTYQERADEVATLSGLGLSRSVLNKIYWQNARRFLDGDY